MTTAVRTGGRGAGGVSVLVIPTHLTGFSARKIRNSGNNAGGSAWITLDNVKVPAENIVGPLNGGFLPLMTSKRNQRRAQITLIANQPLQTSTKNAS